MTVFQRFCKNLLSENDKTSKNIIFVGNLNINHLEYEPNKKVQHILSRMFQYNMILTINKPTHLTRITATAIDHIIANTVISHIQHRSGIKKSDISDHFSISKKVTQKIRLNLFISVSTEKKKYSQLFKYELSQIEWNNIIKTLDNPNTAYRNFFNIFSKTYNKYFPKVRIKTQAKTIQNPWITKGITKTSKKKQKLYEWFFKKRSPQNEQKYKHY